MFDSAVPPGDFRTSLCESGVVIYTTYPTNVRDGLALLVRAKSGVFSRLEAGPSRFYPPARAIGALRQKLERDPNATLDLYDALARTMPNADVESVILVL